LRHSAIILHALKGRLQPTVWVTAEVIFSEAFSLALFAVQARLLGPTVFGLVAVVMVLISFWDAVLHKAVIEALVSVRRIEDRHYATAAVGMVLVSLIFAAVVFVCAKPAAALFEDEELASVMRAMAVLPVFAAFSVVPLAAARREIRFQTTTIRTIISLIAGGVVGLVLALMGGGAWALVGQALVQRLVAVIFIWSAVRPPFLALSIRHACDLVTFARPLLISGIMSWGSGQLPRLFLGVYLGPTELGLFTTAGRFNAMVKQIALTPKAFVARVDLIRFVNDRRAFAKAARRMFL
jgi:teichuronic acid exporter